MPLTFAKIGELNSIQKIVGKDETKRFLESLGFVVGETVTIISELGGNMIISVKNSRVALDRSMASRIVIAWKLKYNTVFSNACMQADGR